MNKEGQLPFICQVFETNLFLFSSFPTFDLTSLGADATDFAVVKYF